jgi:hypothetical protein
MRGAVPGQRGGQVPGKRCRLKCRCKARQGFNVKNSSDNFLPGIFLARNGLRMKILIKE